MEVNQIRNGVAYEENFKKSLKLGVTYYDIKVCPYLLSQ